MLAFALLLTQTVGYSGLALAANFEVAEPANPEGEQKEVYDLVVLLVDESIRENGALESRVNRYADDIRDNYPMMDVQFLFMADDDAVEDVAGALEALYRSGAGEHVNKMTGVVMIGDLPLPVVNKNGNRFVSMLPFTDFEDKAYVFNEERESFEFSGKKAKAEVWHGVIKGSNEELVSFFDKNHGYYEGDPEFSEFDKKVFFGDLIAEEEQMNDEAYGRYVDYLNYAEDLAYNRYNKQWAKELSGEVYDDLELDEEYVEADFLAALQDQDMFENLPDIHSKPIIDQFLIPYYKIFNRYVSSLNDWTDYTGRYTTSDVDSMPELITAKDEYSKFYLKEVNTALEAKIDEVISRIAEPLPLLESVVVSGSFIGDAANEGFRVQVFNENNNGENPLFGAQEFKFHYTNPANGELYVNGIEAANLNSPLLCSVYLGSENNDNTKISTLTRSTRSDNFATSLVAMEVGANLVSTEGGYVIEKNERYGVPAFFESPLFLDGVGAFEKTFEEGDVIQSINGRLLTSTYTFKQAIEDNYDNLSSLIKAINDDEFERLEGIDGKLMVRLPNAADGVEEVEFYDTRAEIVNSARLRAGRVRSIVGYLDINYLRDGEADNVKLSFTVSADGQVLFPSSERPTGSGARLPQRVPIEVVVLPNSMQFPVNFVWGRGSDGAIFGMNDNNIMGYLDRPLGPDAGCNANSTSRNSDRCLGKFATVPVLDPAGSVTTALVDVPGEGVVRDFPNRVKMNGEGQNSGREVDFENAVDIYDFYYDDLTRVDELLMDSCFGTPLASYAVNGEDSYPYQGHVIAKTTANIGLGDPLGGDDSTLLDKDFYGKLLRSVAEFAGGLLADDVDYENGAAIEDGSDFNPSQEIWAGTDKFRASDILLNDVVGEEVTLKIFADHYGLIDGRDNNGNGIADYVWVDTDDDGVADTKNYDFAEANPELYGIANENLPEVARKLLSKVNTLVIPYSDPDFPEQWKIFNRDVLIRVRPQAYEGMTIPSLVEHKEPTNYTIMQQLTAGTTLDLPIDNPRYVAFVSSELASPDYPEPQPVDGNVDVEAIMDGLDLTRYRAVGDVERVDYINLFDEGINSFASLQVALVSKANEIAALPGSYRIFGEEAEEGDYEGSEIAEEILTAYLLPTITSVADNPISGFDLTRADSRKIADALRWINQSIDEKHHYVLEKYLSGADDDKAYVSEPTNGYEASYLVLDGQEDMFNLSFSREVNEDDRRFDPVSRLIDNAGENDGAGVAGGEDGEDDPGFEFVWLDQFLDELERFSDSFTFEPNFEQACGYSEYLDAILNGRASGEEQVIDSIEVSAERTRVASGGDLFTVKAEGFDENGNLVLRSNDPFTLEVTQNEEVVSVNGESTALLNGGEINYSFYSENEGVARMRIVSESGVASNTVQVVVSDKRLALNGDYAVVADPENELAAEVVVLDKEGKLIKDQTLEVSLRSEKGLFDVVDNAVIENGVLNVSLKPGTVAGSDNLIVEVLNDGSFPVMKEAILVEAGPAAILDVSSDSFVLVGNGESKTNLDIVVKDKYGNVANNDFSQITVFADRLVEVDPSVDVNPELVGIQLSTFDGRASVDVFSRDAAGEANLIALLLDYDLEEELLAADGDFDEVSFEGRIGKSFKIDVKEDVDILVEVLNRNFEAVNSVVADGQGLLRIGAKLQSNGEVIDYSGDVVIDVVTDELGYLVSDGNQKMNSGSINAANNTVRTNTTSGVMEVLVKVPGFTEEVFEIALRPGAPSQITLTTSDDNLDTSQGSETRLVASLTDEFGNLVTTNTGTRVTFESSAASSDLVSLRPGSALSLNGVASTTVVTKGVSGTANLIASVEGIGEGTLQLPVRKEVSLEEVADFQPRSLYVSLLGGNFGDQMKDNIAEALLFNGQTQAVSSLSASSEQADKLVMVDGYGMVENLSENIRTKVVLANENSAYQKVMISDPIADKELMSVFLVPDPDTELVLLDEDEEVYGNDREGIFVKKVQEVNGVSLRQIGQQVVIEDEGEVAVSIDEFGRISLPSEAFSVRLLNDNDDILAKHFALMIEKRGVAVASIIYKDEFEEGIRQLPYNTVLNNFFPGVYVQLLTSDGRYDFEDAYSRNMSNAKLGVYLVDNETALRGSLKAGVPDKFGYGFEGDNKHMLLFAAGNSVGSSNLPYMAESTIIYGDPLVRVEVDESDVSLRTGFTNDIGKPLYQGDEDIEEMINFDFNGDGEDDLLMLSKDGKGRVLENVVNMDKFWDRGEVLDVFGRVMSTAKIDINNDGYDDLIVGTEESCREDEECVSVYVNTGSGFEREALDIDLDGNKVNQMEGADFNNDGCEDLVVSDSAGRISVYHNVVDDEQCIGLESRPMKRFDFGYSLDADSNQAENLFVQYPGMAVIENKIIEFVLRGEAGDEKLQFIHLPADNGFNNSEKKSSDLNGGSLALGDTVEVLLTLRNSSGADVNGLKVSDSIPPSVSVDSESLKCLSLSCGNISFRETGSSLRPLIIDGVSVAAGAEVVMSYRFVVEEMTEISFNVGNSFADYPSNDDDDYLDIVVKPRAGDNGRVTYLYSTGLDPRGRVIHDDFVAPIENDVAAEASVFDSLADFSIDPNDENPEVPDDIKDEINRLQNEQRADNDYDGLPDTWDSALNNGPSAAEQVGDKIESTISSLRCSGGGCLPNPYNYAFLVPDGVTPGIAAIAAGVPSLPPVRPFYPSSSASAFRLYLSPTLSGGLGTAACLGPSIGHQSPCYAFAIPPAVTGTDAVCSEISGGLNDALSGSKNSTVDPATGMAAVVTDGQNVASNNDLNLDFNESDSDSPISAAGKANIKIPGFPSVLTNWVDNQVDEIYNKLLDFPDVYFILPDISSFVQDNATAVNDVSFNGFNDFARTISSIPLVQIESKPILVRVPSVSKNQVEKYEIQWERWSKNLQKQLDDRIAFWDCDSSADKRSVCDQIVADVGDLLQSVQKLSDNVDRIANFPRDLLNYRNLEAKYANQIVCYLDAVTAHTGGYIKKQGTIVESWMKAIKDAVRTFQDWRVVLDLMVQYQQSCDQCRNDRFSKLGILLEFFAAIPEPPIIPIPKWPDLTVDLSNIKTGVKILWPDVTFRPEPIVLPNLPEIVLPEILPEVRIELPGFEVPDLPNWQLPDLPDLPPLPLPDLPDLPKPPRIPPLPNAVAELAADLRPIFRILCLLKTGLIPVPEWGLETEIETLTQPSVSVVLPIIKNLGIKQTPIEYEFVREIQVDVKSRFDINTDFIYKKVKDGMDKWNDKVSELTEELNKYSRLNYGAKLSNALQNLVDKAADDVLGEDGAGIELPGGVDLDVNRPSSMIDLEKRAEEFDEEIRQYIAELEDYPEEYNLVAEERYLYADDPILNRSLSEVERSIAQEQLVDDPLVKELANMRNLALNYAKNLEESNALLEGINDINEFSRVLVDSDQSTSLFASTDLGESTARPGTVSASLFSEGIQEEISDAAFAEGSLLAANVGVDAADLVDAATGSSEGGQEKGIFVFVDGMNENIMNYTFELGKKTHVLFSDVDDDEDNDVIIAFGGDVYLKENYKNEDERLDKKGRVIERNTSVDDYQEQELSVDGLRVDVNNGKLLVNFEGVQRDIAGYEVVLSRYMEGRERLRDAEQRYFVAVDDISDLRRPNIELEVLNGHYYVSVVVVELDGSKSLPSDHRAAGPSICLDVSAPFPTVRDANLVVPIYSEVEIDASNSFDSDGKIVSYYLESMPFDGGIGKVVTEVPEILWSDLNVAVDTDLDGVKWNDRSNPKFKIGPFVNEGDVGEHKFILHVADEALNKATQKITVNVVVPEISLDDTFARTQVAQGEVLPMVKDLPFAIMRTRYIYRVQDGELLSVPYTEKIAEGFTDSNGKYRLDDFEDENMIIVEDADGNVLAEINPETGNIVGMGGGEVRVYEAQLPDLSTRIEVLADNGEVLATVYVVGDVNSDVAIGSGDADGIEVVDRNDGDALNFYRVGADDLNNPGGVLLIDANSGEVVMSVDAGGNIVVMDDGLSLRVKENNHKSDPLTIELLSSRGNVLAEVILRTGKNAPLLFMNDAQVPAATPKGVSPAAFYAANKEVIGLNAVNEAIDLFGEEELVTRGQFTKALLNMMCIVPRDPEAYQAYAAGEGYSDILFNANDIGELYPYIKEATLLGLVEGYVGEIEDGLAPFKPGGTVTRAEAVTMIARALEMKGEIEAIDRSTEGIWYEPFMELGVELGVITVEEALEPNKEMNYGELLTMVRRVLAISSCQAEDLDGDNMSDFCEATYGIDDPAGDEDGDGLRNDYECRNDLNPIVAEDGDSDGDGLLDRIEVNVYGTDPLDPDTDAGGINDGDEVAANSNPLVREDDGEAGIVSSGEEGVFVVPAECNSCPCISTLKNKADIMPGDSFFPVIFKDYLEPVPHTHIFNKGNEVFVD